MIGEREDILNENQYGNLTMRPYDIDGNEINAFYDDSDDLVFVLDNTINQTKPNVLLVINPSGDKKWDEILSGQYDVDLETIRPKQDNKYQKLDIEYSGLSVYENLINAYVAGDDLSEHLIQLNILRDSAARHSAMTRLNVANEIIAKTNMTIVKTKESIVRLQTRIKTLRTKLSETKKEIGRVSTKQSAAKILKLESQIEATNEKLKRAQKRLESAQKRLEVATVDAELASDLLNQPALEVQNIAKSKPVAVVPKYEVRTTDDEESVEEDDDNIEDNDTGNEEQDDNEEEYDTNNEIKPLFDENPNNIDENIAFKPITFDAPAVPVSKIEDNPVPVFNPEPMFEDKGEESETEDFVAPDMNKVMEQQQPVLESVSPVPVSEEETVALAEEQKPVLESITPIIQEPIEQSVAPMYEEQPTNIQTTSEQQPVAVEPQPVMPAVAPVSPIAPVPPVVNTFNANVTTSTSRSKPTFIYYMLLIILIGLSVFTLWLYQKNMDTKEPLLEANVAENVAEEQNPTFVERLRVNAKKQIDKAKNVVEKVKVTKAEKVEPQEPESEEYEFAPEEEESTLADTEQPVAEETKNEEPVIESTETVVVEEPEMEEESGEEESEPESVATEPEDDIQSKEQDINDDAEETVQNVNEINVDKPVYEVGPKHDDMIVSEQDYQANVQDAIEPENSESEMEFDEEEYYEE